MQKEVHSIPWISVTLLLLAIATVGFSLQPDFGVTGALVYRDYGYGGYGGGYYGGGGFFGYGGLSITEFYQAYAVYIDAIIFLLLFFGVGKAVFLNHFKSGGKAVYIAVGLALTLGLMMWEERMNRSLIAELGPWGLAILVIVVLAGCYIAALHLSERFTGKKKHWLAILLTIVFVIALGALFPDTAQFLLNILSAIWTGIMWIIDRIAYTLNLNSPVIILWLIITFIIGRIIFVKLFSK